MFGSSGGLWLRQVDKLVLKAKIVVSKATEVGTTV